MFDKKFTRRMSMLLSTTVMSSMLFNFDVKAANKETYAEGLTAIVGDMQVAFNTSNLINALKIASSRGLSDDKLDVYYVMTDKPERLPDGNIIQHRKYFNLTNDYSLDEVKNPPLLTKEGKDLWPEVKGIVNASGEFELFENVEESSDSQIEAKPEFTGVISVDNNSDPKTITVPENSTADSIKLMTRPKGEDKFVEQVYKLEGDTLTVTAENGTSTTYVVEVKKGGSGENQGISETPQIKTSFENGETISYNLNEEASDLTVTVENLATEDKTGIRKEDVSYQWYKQKVGTSPQSRINVPAEGAIEGATGASYTPLTDEFGTTVYFVVVTHKETFTENGETKTKEASSVMSNMVTVAVTEGELVENTDFTVDDYVYNMASDEVETMGKLTGKAPSKAKITIEANFEEIATTDAKEDGTWEATFPRQNAGTKLKVTLTANGKTATIVKEVKEADDKALDDFRKSIDLNKLIEVRDNLYLSKDKGATGIKAADLKDKAANDPDPVSLKDGDYYIEDDRNAVKAFKVYVDLIEAVLGYKYQISDVDLKYIQNIAIPTLETYKDKIQQVNGDKVTTYELKLSVGGNKQGTVTIKDKDAGAIVGDTSSVTNGVYTINNGKTVTITAIPNAQNTLAGWSIDKEFSKDNNTTREEKVTKDKSVEAVFASPEEATKIDEVIKEIEEITANGTKPFEVSISETAPSEDKIKATVEAAIKEILPEGAEVKGVVLEEIPTRATTKNYKATVTFKVGDIEFTITIEISVKVDSSITNVTANVTKSVYDKTNKGTKFDLNLTPYVEGITKTDITLTDGEGKEVDITSVTEAGTGGAKYYEVLAKLTKDIEYTIKVTKDGYNISTAKVTGLDEDSSTPTPVTASVSKAAYDDTNKGTKFDLNLTPYVEGITKTDITLTDGEGNKANVTSITEAGTGETKYYEVLAKLTKDVNYTIKVAKDGYDISTATVKGLDADSSTPDEEGNFVQIKSFVIANDAEVGTSVEQIVYQKTVGESASQAVYKIYAKLSNPVANFSVGDTSVKFNLDLSATVTKNNVTTDYPDLLNGLRFNNVTRVLMKELSEDNSKLEITLDLDGVGESEDKATTHTINFKWVEPNKADVTGDPLKALKFKAYKFKK